MWPVTRIDAGLKSHASLVAFDDDVTVRVWLASERAVPSGRRLEQLDDALRAGPAPDLRASPALSCPPGGSPLIQIAFVECGANTYQEQKTNEKGGLDEAITADLLYDQIKGQADPNGTGKECP